MTGMDLGLIPDATSVVAGRDLGLTSDEGG